MSPAAERQNPAQSLLFLSGGVAVTLMLLVAAGSLGIAGVMLNLLVAVPCAYVHMRCGTIVGVGAVGLTALGSYLLGGPAGLAGYVLQFGLVSMVLPFLLRRGWTWGRAASVSVAVTVLCAFVLMAAYAEVSGSTVDGLVDAYTRAEADKAMAMYTTADLTPDQVQELNAAVGQMADFLRYTWPGLAVTVTGFLALLLLWFLSALSRGTYMIPGPVFAFWKAHEFLVWPLIAAGFAAAFAGGELKRVGVNVLVILLPVYFMQGMAVVTHFFNRRKVPPFMRGIGYILIAFLNPMPMIITGIGVFDLWIDFRKPRVKTT